jgi:iron complex outermembrane receptor protein
MRHIAMLILCMAFLYGNSYAQKTYTLKGKVVDENNIPLIGAAVTLDPSEKGTVTSKDGNFIFADLSDGFYIINISYLGYESHSDTLQMNKSKIYKAVLTEESMDLQEVVITDNFADAIKKGEVLNIEIVNEEYLKQNLGGSLMNSLERLPGVTTIDIGSGQSKPVIRGLGFNRVVVIENGIKHEAQQWGADHGLEIDQFAVDIAEVIKGPGSLIYGSDALGGVIILRHNSLPDQDTFGGKIDLTGKSNNDLYGTSASLFVRTKKLYVNLRFTFLNYSDYKVPTDSIDIYSYRAPLFDHMLRNTAGNERNLHANLAYTGEKFQNKVFFSTVNNSAGFFANAHGLEPRNVDTELHDKSSRDINYPFQDVTHIKLINSGNIKLGKLKSEYTFGFQKNFRQEYSQYVNHGYMPALFPDTLAFNSDIEREFEKYIYSGNLKLSYTPGPKLQIVTGITGEYQDNRINGRGFIIPAFTQLFTGIFFLGKYHMSERSIFQGGIRYDFAQVNAKEYLDWFPSPVINNSDTSYQYLIRSENLDRSFSNTTWSAGYTFNSARWSLKANLGKSFRVPTAKELAANGVNYHRFSYEIGNPDLSPEISYQIDAGVELNLRKFAIGITPFLNYFTNYIYLNPSSDHDRLYGNGNQIFYYTESEVLRYGGEIHSHYQLTKSIQLGILGEYVYSEQRSGEKTGFTLPFSPPASAILNIKYRKQNFSIADNIYVSVDYRLTASQNRIVPPEEITNGYQTVNIGLGGSIQINKQRLNIAFQVQNIFNKKYFNHTSYYRLINVPEPGRNYILNITVPFSGRFNRKQ